jgi:phage-related protein
VASKLGQVLRDIKELTVAEQRQVREALDQLIERHVEKPAAAPVSANRSRLEDGLMKAIANAQRRGK